MGSWMGAGHQKDQALIGSLEFSAPPIRREGRGAGSGVNDPTCPCDEDATKIPKVWGSESFQVHEHKEVLGDGSPTEGKHISCPTRFSI